MGKKSYPKSFFEKEKKRLHQGTRSPLFRAPRDSRTEVLGGRQAAGGGKGSIGKGGSPRYFNTREKVARVDVRRRERPLFLFKKGKECGTESEELRPFGSKEIWSERRGGLNNVPVK